MGVECRPPPEAELTLGALVRFFSGVDPHVLHHLVFPAEAFAAVRAAVRPLATVCLHVSLQVIGRHQAQATQRAGMAFAVTCVCPQMQLKASSLSVAAATVHAAERTLAAVDAHVTAQVLLPLVALPAFHALMAAFTCVGQQVALQVTLSKEAQATELTGKGPLARVSPHVLHQRLPL